MYVLLVYSWTTLGTQAHGMLTISMYVGRWCCFATVRVTTFCTMPCRNGRKANANSVRVTYIDIVLMCFSVGYFLIWLRYIFTSPFLPYCNKLLVSVIKHLLMSQYASTSPCMQGLSHD